jgi:hypothetical protein
VEQNITNVVAVAASDLAVLDFQLASLLPPFTQLNAVMFIVGCKNTGDVIEFCDADHATRSLIVGEIFY